MDQSSELDPLSRRLLEAFDQLRCEELDLASLTPALPDVLAPPEDLREQAARMVEQGWLRPVADDRFARTEQGRLAVTGPLQVTLYSRPGCHLCEEAKERMAPLLCRHGVGLREVNVDADLDLRERYTNDVPVIFLGARKVAKHRVDIEQFRRQLERAVAEAANPRQG